MLATFEENGGELTEEMEEILAINRSDLDETIEEHVSIMLHLKAEIEQFKIDKEKLETRKKMNEFLIQKLRDGLKVAVQKYGTENKLKSGLYSFSIRKTQVLEINDVSQIPTKYFTYKLKTPLSREIQAQISRLMARFPLDWDESIKMDELKEAVKKGEVINYGFEMVENTSVVIR